ATRLRKQRGLGNAPAPRNRDRRWADREPGADALHHPGHVPLPRSLRRMVQPGLGPGAFRNTARGCGTGTDMRYIVVSALIALAGCAVGPNYHRPAAANPQRFKEAEGWKPAEPREAASGTDWWSIYGDATLDELEKQIDISNQTLKAS